MLVEYFYIQTRHIQEMTGGNNLKIGAISYSPSNKLIHLNDYNFAGDFKEIDTQSILTQNPLCSFENV